MTFPSRNITYVIMCFYGTVYVCVCVSVCVGGGGGYVTFSALGTFCSISSLFGYSSFIDFV